MTRLEIRNFLLNMRQRRDLGENVPTLTEIARRACLSRQTIYAFLGHKHSEFGEVAQIRLSRVIQQISADLAYKQTRLMSIDLTTEIPTLRFGVR
jgi:hypothetical protein